MKLKRFKIIRNGKVFYSRISGDNIFEDTGYCDKNGNRIYEGDICEKIDGKLVEVVFDLGSWQLRKVGTKSKVYISLDYLYKSLLIKNDYAIQEENK